MRGSRQGCRSNVESQFIKATASWLAHSRKMSVKKTSFQPNTPTECACCTKPSVASSVSAPIPPA